MLVSHPQTRQQRKEQALNAVPLSILVLSPFLSGNRKQKTTALITIKNANSSLYEICQQKTTRQEWSRIRASHSLHLLLLFVQFCFVCCCCASPSLSPYR